LALEAARKVDAAEFYKKSDVSPEMIPDIATGMKNVDGKGG
jgi:hypothetical protein